MKKFIKKFLPFLIPLSLIPEYLYDYFRYIKYSGVLNVKSSKEKLIAKIVAECHIIEKGLTMPETRLGFGKENMKSIIDHCFYFINNYGKDVQLEHAISVIKEYMQYHNTHPYKLDPSLDDRIKTLLKYANNINACEQQFISKSDYFKYSNCSFNQFSESRKSIRNYSNEDIPLQVIKDVVDLSKNAPSSCNRQGNRVHVISDKKAINTILDIQGGNRGFGHLTNKLLVITAELAVSHGVYERHQVYVDGGLFAMNILYSLHFNNIASCPLNCNFSIKKDKELRKIINIKESEVFILMISCGYVPEEFRITLSKRYPVEHFLHME